MAVDSESLNERTNRIDHEIEHGRRQPGVGADEHNLFHDCIGAGEIADDTEGVRPIFFELHEHRLPNEVAAKKHTVADLLLIEAAGQLEFRKRSGGVKAEHETEPGADVLMAGVIPGKTFRAPAGGMRRQHETEEFGAIIQAAAQVIPIIDAGLDELRQALELDAANG